MLYGYKCHSCGATYEVMREMEDRKRPEPCTCGDVAVKQFFPNPAHFNCGGFYETDQGKKNFKVKDIDEPIVIEENPEGPDRVVEGKKMKQKIGNKQ
jgi:putative FmdB family regulatory protein